MAMGTHMPIANLSQNMVFYFFDPVKLATSQQQPSDLCLVISFIR